MYYCECGRCGIKLSYHYNVSVYCVKETLNDMSHSSEAGKATCVASQWCVLIRVRFIPDPMSNLYIHTCYMCILSIPSLILLY